MPEIKKSNRLLKIFNIKMIKASYCRCTGLVNSFIMLSFSTSTWGRFPYNFSSLLDRKIWFQNFTYTKFKGINMLVPNKQPLNFFFLNTVTACLPKLGGREVLFDQVFLISLAWDSRMIDTPCLQIIGTETRKKNKINNNKKICISDWHYVWSENHKKTSWQEPLIWLDTNFPTTLTNSISTCHLFI